MPIVDPSAFSGQAAPFVDVSVPVVPVSGDQVAGLSQPMATPMMGSYGGSSGYEQPGGASAQQAVMLGYQQMQSDAYDALQRVKIGAVYGAQRLYQDATAFGTHVQQAGYFDRSVAPTYDPQSSTFFGSVGGALGLNDLARNETPGAIRTDAVRDLSERVGVMGGAGFTELALPGAAFTAASALIGGPVGMAAGLAATLGMDAFVNADMFRDHLARGAFIEQSSGRYMRPGTSSDVDGSGFSRSETGELTRFIEEMRRGDDFFSGEEIDDLSRDFTFGGVFDSTRSVDDFKRNFTEAKDSLRYLMTEMGTSIEEGVALMRDLSSIGITGGDISGTIQQVKQAASASGLSSAAALSMTVGTSTQLFQGTGIDIQTGVGLAAANLERVGQMELAGSIEPETLRQLGGIQGAAQTMTAMQAQALHSQPVRNLMQAAFRGTDQLDMNVIGRALSGELSANDIGRLARDTLMADRTNYLAFEGQFDDIIENQSAPVLQALGSLPLLTKAMGLKRSHPNLDITPDILEGLAMTQLGMTRNEARLRVEDLTSIDIEAVIASQRQAQQAAAARTDRESSSGYSLLHPVDSTMLYGRRLFGEHVADPMTRQFDRFVEGSQAAFNEALGVQSLEGGRLQPLHIREKMEADEAIGRQALRPENLTDLLGPDAEVDTGERGNDLMRSLREENFVLRDPSIDTGELTEEIARRLEEVPDERKPIELLSLADERGIDLTDPSQRRSFQEAFEQTGLEIPAMVEERGNDLMRSLREENFVLRDPSIDTGELTEEIARRLEEVPDERKPIELLSLADERGIDLTDPSQRRSFQEAFEQTGLEIPAMVEERGKQGTLTSGGRSFVMGQTVRGLAESNIAMRSLREENFVLRDPSIDTGELTEEIARRLEEVPDERKPIELLSLARERDIDLSNPAQMGSFQEATEQAGVDLTEIRGDFMAGLSPATQVSGRAIQTFLGRAEELAPSGVMTSYKLPGEEGFASLQDIARGREAGTLGEEVVEALPREQQQMVRQAVAHLGNATRVQDELAQQPAVSAETGRGSVDLTDDFLPGLFNYTKTEALKDALDRGHLNLPEDAVFQGTEEEFGAIDDGSYLYWRKTVQLTGDLPSISYKEGLVAVASKVATQEDLYSHQVVVAIRQRDLEAAAQTRNDIGSQIQARYHENLRDPAEIRQQTQSSLQEALGVVADRRSPENQAVVRAFDEVVKDPEDLQKREVLQEAMAERTSPRTAEDFMSFMETEEGFDIFSPVSGRKASSAQRRIRNQVADQINENVASMEAGPQVGAEEYAAMGQLNLAALVDDDKATTIDLLATVARQVPDFLGFRPLDAQGDPIDLETMPPWQIAETITPEQRNRASDLVSAYSERSDEATRRGLSHLIENDTRIDVSTAFSALGEAREAQGAARQRLALYLRSQDSSFVDAMISTAERFGMSGIIPSGLDFLTGASSEAEVAAAAVEGIARAQSFIDDEGTPAKEKDKYRDEIIRHESLLQREAPEAYELHRSGALNKYYDDLKAKQYDVNSASQDVVASKDRTTDLVLKALRDDETPGWISEAEKEMLEARPEQQGMPEAIAQRFGLKEEGLELLYKPPEERTDAEDQVKYEEAKDKALAFGQGDAVDTSVVAERNLPGGTSESGFWTGQNADDALIQVLMQLKTTLDRLGPNINQAG